MGIKREPNFLDLLVPDPWKNLRKDMNLFRAVEPNVKLIAITTPSDELRKLGVTSETLPAYTARHCWESDVKYTEDPQQNYELDKQLTKSLIQRGHTTPLQALEYVFDVFGTSKTLQAQWTRHKIGVGWSYRSTRFVEASGNNFVYNVYNEIQDSADVKKLLLLDEDTNKRAIENYEKHRSLGATKEDSRRGMPVQFATHCAFYTNARAMRHQFGLRLAKKAEWEFRRMTGMILDICMDVTPVIYEDIYQSTLERLTRK